MLGYVILTVQFKQEDRRWTAFCPELGTAAYGRTLSEAQKRIAEAIDLHLNTLEEVGERKRFFKENSIRIHWKCPSVKRVEIKAPLDRETFVQARLQPLRHCPA